MRSVQHRVNIFITGKEINVQHVRLWNFFFKQSEPANVNVQRVLRTTQNVHKLKYTDDSYKKMFFLVRNSKTPIFISMGHSFEGGLKIFELYIKELWEIDQITLVKIFLVVQWIIGKKLCENWVEKHLPVGVFPYGLSLKRWNDKLT